MYYCFRNVPRMKLHFSPPAFRQNTHGTSRWHPSKNERSPRWWTVILASGSPLSTRDCFIVTFEWAVPLWSSFDYLWMRMWRGDEAREIRQTYLFFAKLGNYSSPLKFWDRLMLGSSSYTHPSIRTILLIEFFLCKSLKLICPSLLKSDKTILDSLVIPI